MKAFICSPLYWEVSDVSRLIKTYKASIENYSTSSLFGYTPQRLFRFEIGNTESKCLQIEIPHEGITLVWSSIDVNLINHDSCDMSDTINLIRESFKLTSKSEGLYSTIENMVKSIHIIKSNGEGYDKSYSDPNIPFSIFISIPHSHEKYATERLAENIIHEALHLQLTLIEKEIPLVIEAKDSNINLSPWKGENRSTQGLLHAVYVFANLYAFWTIIMESSKSSQSKIFALNRKTTIEKEMKKASHLINCNALSERGIELSKLLLDSVKSYKYN